MSLAAIDWALNLPLKQPLKGVLVALANHANKEGWAWPSRTLIAAEASVALRTAIYATKRLEDLGLIEVERSSGRTANRYHLGVGSQYHAAGNGDSGTPLEGDSGTPSSTGNHAPGAPLNRASTLHLTTSNHAPGALNPAPDDLNPAPGAPKPYRTVYATVKNHPPSGGTGGEIRTSPKPRSRRTLPAAPPEGTPVFGKDGLREIKGLNGSAFAEWDGYRQQRGGRSRSSWTDVAKLKTAKLMASESLGDQQAMVNKSIANGWQGLFPPGKWKPSGKFDAGEYMLNKVRKRYEQKN